MRVRHLLPALGRVPRDLGNEGASGLVRIAFELARAQLAQGHAVELYGWQPGSASSTYDLQGIAVHVTPGWRWARTKRVDARMVAPLVVSSALGGRASINHVHSEPHLLLAPRARARILHYHTPIPVWQSPTYRWLVRHRAARVVCCSDFIRRQFLERVDYPAEHCTVVHGGVDVGRYHRFGAASDPKQRSKWGIAPDETAILYAGAVVAEKGLVKLLEGMHQMRGVHPELRFRLLIAGNAGLWRTIEAAPAAGLDAYSREALEMSHGLPVSWLGVVADEAMPGLYAAADIVTCPSTWDDPFPTVTLEAMAAGKPIVASRVGGVPEAVVDNVTGILVQAANPGQLGAALAHLIANPDARRQMGDAARTRSALFTNSVAAAKLDALYREVLTCD